MKAKIPVDTATGKIGFAVACKNIYPVRAFVHHDNNRAKLLKDAGAEIFIINMLKNKRTGSYQR